MRETTREPHSNRVQIGDVAFIHEGRLYLLFSARSPLGGRQLGVDVPDTFKQLDIEEIDECDPLTAGYFCTNGVRATSSSPSLPCVRSIPFISSITSGLNFSGSGSASTISFDLTGEKGAILLAKDLIYRENARRWGAFDAYVKEHYASWVAFARKNRYGDVDPVLITGVDRTPPFGGHGTNQDSSTPSPVPSHVALPPAAALRKPFRMNTINAFLFGIGPCVRGRGSPRS